MPWHLKGWAGMNVIFLLFLIALHILAAKRPYISGSKPIIAFRGPDENAVLVAHSSFKVSYDVHNVPVEFHEELSMTPLPDGMYTKLYVSGHFAVSSRHAFNSAGFGPETNQLQRGRYNLGVLLFYENGTYTGVQANRTIALLEPSEIADLDAGATLWQSVPDAVGAGDIAMALHNPQRCFISASIYVAHAWAANEVRLFSRLLGPVHGGVPQRLVVDVGAHIGWFTLQAAALGHEVLALEPLRRNRDRLRKSIEQNGMCDLVSLVPAALGECSEHGSAMQMIVDPNRNYGNGELPWMWDNDGIPSQREVAETVHVACLDRLVDEPIYMLKIDAEGYEDHVLAGASSLINRHVVWFIMLEYSPNLLRGRKRDPQEMLRKLFVKGYSIFRLNERLSDEAAATGFGKAVIEEVKPSDVGRLDGGGDEQHQLVLALRSAGALDFLTHHARIKE